MFYDGHKTIEKMYGHTKAGLLRVTHTLSQNNDTF